MGAFVPTDWVADDLPANYTPFELTQGIASVILELLSCNKIAVNGVDVGAGSLAFFTAPINRPTETQEAEAIDYFVYLFEVHTDNPALAVWFNSIGAAVENGTITHMHDSPDPGFGMLSTDLKSGNEPVYSLQGVNHKPKFPHEERFRFLFGPDPRANYWDDTSIRLETGGYPVVLQTAPSSKMAQVFEGLVAPEPFVTAVDSLTRFMEPP